MTDLRALRYSPNGDVYYKLRFRDEWQALPQRRDKQVKVLDWNELSNLYQDRRKIKKQKFEHLQELKRSIPTDYHDFYNNLLYEH